MSSADPPVKLISLVGNDRRASEVRQSLAESKVQKGIEAANLAELEKKLAAAKTESNQIAIEAEKLLADRRIWAEEIRRLSDKSGQKGLGADKLAQLKSEAKVLAGVEKKLQADMAQLEKVRRDHDRMQIQLVKDVWKSRQNLTELQRTGEILTEKLREIDFLPTEQEENPEDKVTN